MFSPPFQRNRHKNNIPVLHSPSQNIDVVCMPKPGDFTHSEAKKNSRNSRPSSSSSSSFRSGGVERDLDLDHKCYVTGWGRRTECE